MTSVILTKLFPHFFVKEPIPSITNPDLLATIAKLRRASSLEKAVQTSLDILASKYQSKRFETYLFFYKWYEKDPNKLWHRSGFMHCTQQNYLLRILLIESGWLTDDAIELGFSLVWYVSPHQFLKLRLSKNKHLAADPWNYRLGAGFGYYASGFGWKKLDA